MRLRIRNPYLRTLAWYGLGIVAILGPITAGQMASAQGADATPPAAIEWQLVSNATIPTAPTETHATPRPDYTSFISPMGPPPNACYSLSCSDYGNAASTSKTSKAKQTYPYLLTETRINAQGRPYTYTRWVMAPPIKATKTP